MSEIERRRAPRKDVRVSVLCRTGLGRCEAVLASISVCGALLEQFSSTLPEIDSPIEFECQPMGWKAPIVLTGTVVRQTEGGVAIQLISISEELVKLVDELD